MFGFDDVSLPPLVIPLCRCCVVPRRRDRLHEVFVPLALAYIRGKGRR